MTGGFDYEEMLFRSSLIQLGGGSRGVIGGLDRRYIKFLLKLKSIEFNKKTGYEEFHPKPITIPL